MGKIGTFNLNGAVDQWGKQIKSISSITESDCEEIKYGLLDMVDDLKSRGLDDEEAFLVASGRFNKIYELQEEFEKENMPKLQMRRIIQVFSGALIFFLMFFLMHSTSKLLFMALNKINVPVQENMRYVYYYILAYHFFIIFLTVILYFFGRKSLKRVESISIKPKHLFVLFFGIICFAVMDYWFFEIIKSDFNLSIKINVQFTSILDYSRYSFPFIFMICFILLYKKYYTLCFGEEGQRFTEQASPGKGNANSLTINIQEDQLSELVKKGLNSEEASLVVAKRNGLRLPHREDNAMTERPFKAAVRVLLIVLSGVLFYFMLYYFLHASSRILLTVLQYIKDEPSFSFQWTRWYVLAFHLIFIFFTVSIYIKDVNLINKIERIKIKPRHTIWVLFSTILIAFVNRRFFELSRSAFNNDPTLLFNIERIFAFSYYTFPFLVFTCLLLLFRKYYRDNMKTG